MTINSTFKPITRSAIERAEIADPHSRSCLIENCSRNQAIQVVQVFDREASAIPHIINGLEWNWRMAQGTLNLDTRSNIFFLSASMRQLYVHKKWILLPEKNIVMQYFDKMDFPLTRRKVRHVEGDSFQYIFVPIQDMQNIYVTRQLMPQENSCYTIHEYPFQDFPLLTSHIHPKYAILQAGSVLRSGLDVRNKSSLMERFPWLDEVEQLYLTWTGVMPREAMDDPIYNSRIPIDQNPSSCPDSDGTPLHRIQPILSSNTEQNVSSSVQAPKPRSNRRKRPVDDDGDSPRPKKRRLLTSSAVEMQKDVDEMDLLEWSSERILNWVRGCRSRSHSPNLAPQARSPALSLSPPPPPLAKPLLRRSEHLKAKLRKT
ncbi:hypothetical protein BJ165DRAFT_1501878 [Panaeolus papilionaceus]|nr:hypothetical protein BJ165DRAFT_1501878 [Panaeolus papilionaceus]